MDPDRRRALVVTTAVLLLILALLIGGIFLIARFFQNRGITPSPNPTVFPVVSGSPLPVGSSQPAASGQPTSGGQPAGQTGNKTYNGKGFQLTYPNNWGLLTCNNSANIELDPTNSQDQKSISCDYATKPVTIIVSEGLSCAGETVKLGSHSVVRSSNGEKGGGEIDYKWCAINPNGVDLEITHRVSQTSQPAVSKTDYSQQIEDLISKIKFQ